jgi:rod shape-determining protein MreD
MRPMKTRLYLYGLLIISVAIQAVLVKRTVWFPDMILLMVVFAGVFRGGIEGLEFGLAAGLLRGCFSVGTLPLDIFLFPAVGAISAGLTRMFYRQNPAAQIFTTVIAVFIVVVAHTLYLNITGGNDVEIPFVFRASWKHLAVTVLVSPFVFAFLKESLRLEE